MLYFKLIKNYYIESSSWFGDVKFSTNRVNKVKVRAYMTPKTVHHWHGTNHWCAPTQSIVNEAQLLTCIHAYIHTTNKGCTQTYTYPQTYSQGDMFTHITFIMLIMNFRINIISYMWWWLSIDIMMLTITFIL